MTDIASFEAAISAERFGRYLDWASGDRDQALDLYALNIRLSEALYPPLQMLEVVLRDRIHAILAWNLPQHHEAMRRLTGWLPPGAAAWCFALDRFGAVYPRERIKLAGD